MSSAPQYANTLQLRSARFFSAISSPIIQHEWSLIENSSEAIRLFRSKAWQRTQADERDKVTLFLFHKHNKLYNESWNRTAEAIHTEFIKHINGRFVINFYIMKLLLRNPFPADSLRDFRRQIVTSLIVAQFEALIPGPQAVFFSNVLNAYKAGHIPCGWREPSHSNLCGRLLVA